MKTKTSTPVSNKKTIKVRLDEKTVLYISNIEALKAWRYRFPNAEIMAN